MPEFLELLPPEEAYAKLVAHIPVAALGVERVPTAEAVGRVTARAVIAREPLPAFARSTVDGYAVRASDTFGASDSLPAYLRVIGEVPMGREAGYSLEAGQAVAIHTGGMLPAQADAVVMLEHTQTAGKDEIEVLRAAAVGENILKRGEDVQTGEEVLPAGTRLGPAEIGGLIALGETVIDVARQPKIGILSSGDEVIDPAAQLQPGQVRDINSYTLSALVARAGGLPQRYGIVRDNASDLEKRLSTALQECDLVVITAGSSASTRDLTAEVIQRMGDPGVLVHGVNVRPGKPTILAVCAGKAVIGLPGNPVSALVIARLFVVPLCERLQGLLRCPSLPPMKARLAINFASQAGRQDYLPVRLRQERNEWLAEPIFYKSNLIFTLARADALAVIPADATGLAAGEEVEVFPL